MTDKVSAVYNAAIKDKLFLQDMKDADNDVPSKWFISDNETTFWSALYYGWFVGRYGPVEWKKQFA
jgi:hypothetical protein